MDGSPRFWWQKNTRIQTLGELLPHKVESNCSNRRLLLRNTNYVTERRFVLSQFKAYFLPCIQGSRPRWFSHVAQREELVGNFGGPSLLTSEKKTHKGACLPTKTGSIKKHTPFNDNSSKASWRQLISRATCASCNDHLPSEVPCHKISVIVAVYRNLEPAILFKVGRLTLGAPLRPPKTVCTSPSLAGPSFCDKFPNTLATCKLFMIQEELDLFPDGVWESLPPGLFVKSWDQQS